MESKEYIERKAAYEAACDAVDEWDGGFNPNRCTKIAKAICAVPAADVRPVVHAMWRIWNYPGDEHVECTACKAEYYEEELYLGGNEFPKFCPNCGATMDLQEKEEICPL